MKLKKSSRVRKWSIRFKIIFIILIVLIGSLSIFTYQNLNKLLAEAIHKNFSSNAISDVYELSFGKLSVNLFSGNIRVSDLRIQPIENPVKHYPYINSSFALKGGKLKLLKVNILDLLTEGRLYLQDMEISNPDISVSLNSEHPVMLPFSDSLASDTMKTVNKKQFINSFLLQNFILRGVKIEVNDSYKKTHYEMKDLNVSLKDLFLDDKLGVSKINSSHINVDFTGFSTTSDTIGLKLVKVNSFSLNIDFVAFTRTIDTLKYTFDDFRSEIVGMETHTKDSLYHIGADTIRLNYKEKSLKIKKLYYQPNLEMKAIAATIPFQKEIFSIVADQIEMLQIDFDSLIYKQHFLVDQVIIDSANVHIFKNKSKPIDVNRFPEYFGQQFSAIPIPVAIREVIANNAGLVYSEIKEDGNPASARINDLNGTLTNITNRQPGSEFEIRAEAKIENAAKVHLYMTFDYDEPEFTYEVTVKSFELGELNNLIQAFSPAKVKSGKVDNISFHGKATKTNAIGEMTFLYHDLVVEMQLKEQVKWKNSVISFAANTVLPSNNPEKPEEPHKTVVFQVDRDMNKGFMNILMKSLFGGLKETVLPNKVNHKAHKTRMKEYHNKQKAKKNNKK